VGSDHDCSSYWRTLRAEARLPLRVGALLNAWRMTNND